MKILTRYLLREHAGPFAAALGVLTVLMVVNQLARRLTDLAGKGLPAQVIAEVFALSIPFILAMTVPMAVLVAVLYAFGRLSADNELSALKASGVSLRRLCVPVVLTASLVSIGMIEFSDRVVPETNHTLRQLLVDIGRKKPTFDLREQVVNEVAAGKLFLQASQIDRATNRLYDVVIYDVGARELTRTIYADSGHMAFNETQTDLYLTLYDGHLNEVDFREPRTSQVSEFREHIVRAPGVQDQLERGASGQYRGDREMNVAMMQERVTSARADLEIALDSTRSWTERSIAIARTAAPDTAVQADRGTRPLSLRAAPSAAAADTGDGEGAAARARVELETDARTLTPKERWVQIERKASEPRGTIETARDTLTDPRSVPRGMPARTPSARLEPLEGAARKASTFASRYRELALRAQVERREVNRYLVEIHKKFAIPMAAIVFVLIGAPIGARFPRGGIGMVLLVSLLVFNVYWVGLIAGEDLADRGVITPFWAMWGPNVLFLGVGLWLLYREGRHSATARGGGWDELIEAARRIVTAPWRAARRRAS